MPRLRRGAHLVATKDVRRIWMPRPCAVELPLGLIVAYKERQERFADAQGLAPWRFTFAVQKTSGGVCGCTAYAGGPRLDEAPYQKTST